MLDHSTVLTVIQAWTGNLDESSILAFIIVCLGYFLSYLIE